MKNNTWYGSVNIDGLRVAGVQCEGRDRAVEQTMHYAVQYIEESEKRITITIQKERKQ